MPVRQATWILLALLLSTPLWAADVQTNIGSYESVQTLDGSTAATCGNASRWRAIPVVGSGGPVDMSALNPQIAPGTSPGQVCDFVGTDSANTVSFGHGSGVSLLSGSGTLALGLGTPLSLRWTGTLWQERQFGYQIAAPLDLDLTLTTVGIGQILLNGLPAATLNDVTLQNAFDQGAGSLGEVSLAKPFRLQGATLHYDIFEQGGNGVSGWYDASGNRVPDHWNCPPASTCVAQGDGTDILSLSGTNASLTIHGATNYCEAANASDTYTCNMVPALDRYVKGMFYSFMPTVTGNSGAASINFNALGAKSIKKVTGGITTDLADNDIRVGQAVWLQYDGTNMQMQSTLGNAPAGGSTPPAVAVRRTTNQSIPNNSNTAMAFDVEDFDTDTMWASSPNPSRITFTTSGKYAVLCNVRWAANATGQRIIWLRENGTTPTYAPQIMAGHATLTLDQRTGVIAQFSAGDYVELMLFQDSGAALNATTQPSLEGPGCQAHRLDTPGGAGGSGSGDVIGDDVSTTIQNLVAYSTTGGKNITELTGTQGDILYHTGTTWAKLGVGTSGQLLRTNGAAANPSWASPAFWIPAAAMETTGSCVVGSPAALLTNGPKRVAVTCTDADADSIEFDFPWSGSTVTVTLYAFSVGNNNGEIVEMDFAGQCVLSGASVAAHSTTGEQPATITWGSSTNRQQAQATAAITLQGTCGPGAHVYMRGQIDATATTMTPMTDLRILGVMVQ